MYTLKDLKKLANEMALSIKNPPFILGLKGDLGAGKTAFCQAFIQTLYPQTIVTSPTFSIVQYYHNGLIAHYDLYRIKHPDEFYDLDIFEDMQNKICLIEWPEILNIPMNTIEIKIIDDETRRISLSLHN